MAFFRDANGTVIVREIQQESSIEAFFPAMGHLKSPC